MISKEAKHYMNKTFIISLILLSYCTTAKCQLELKIIINDSTQQTKTYTYEKHHQNLKTLKEELKKHYQQLNYHGYYNYTIDSTTTKNQLTTQYITYHTKTDSIIISAPIQKNNIFKNIKFPLRTTPEKINTTLKNLTSLLDQNNQPFTNIKLTNHHTKSNILKTQLEITTAKLRKIDTVIIQGYENFPKNFISKYAGIKKNTPFSKTKIEKKAASLNNLPFINQIKSPEILFTKDSTSLYLYLTKKNNNYFDGYVGFASNEETGKLQFNGTINLNLTNNLNYGEQLNIYWKNNGEQQSNFTATIKLPYLFNTPITTTTSLNIFRQDSTFSNTTFNITANYTINHKNTIGLFLRTSNSSNNTDTSSENINNYQKTIYGITYTNQQPYTLNPLLQTHAITISAGLGKRNTKDTQTNQALIESEAFYQYSINNTNKLFLQNTIKFLDSKNYYTNELFYFGGINSIRGYDENSLSANFYNVLNFEYRKIISQKIYIHSITDYSHFYNQISSQKKDLFSVGLGLGILNKNSLFKINYASKINNKETQILNNSKIHVSYSTFF